VAPARRKAFPTLDKPVRQRIAVVVDQLAEDPRPPGVKPLSGSKECSGSRSRTPTGSCTCSMTATWWSQSSTQDIGVRSTA